MKIGTQLKLASSGVLAIVLLVGSAAYVQSRMVQKQTETLYSHPLVVRRAIGEVQRDILSLHREMKDLLFKASINAAHQDRIEIEKHEANLSEQIEILYAHYLGPKKDVDDLKELLVEWRAIRNRTLRLADEGKIPEAYERTSKEGVGGKQVEKILDVISRIDIFSRNKADSLYADSENFIKSLDFNVMTLIIAALLLILGINHYLMRAITIPLDDFALMSEKFQSGETGARIKYESDNEFGRIAKSFNELASKVEANMNAGAREAALSVSMLGSDDAKVFFRALLSSLAEISGAQLSAIYILDEKGSRFEHFDSIGAGESAKTAFDAGTLEGEFGLALSRKKICHIADIPESCPFVFNTVSGAFRPKELLTVPLLDGNRVFAVISLGKLGSFDSTAIDLTRKVAPSIASRSQNVLAYRKIKIFTELLEEQNVELKSQKSELLAQSSELAMQNSELDRQKRQLAEASRMKTVFLSNMSHELRTPLNSVIALSGVLSRRLASKIPSEEYAYLGVIERSGKHLLELINDILDLSRIEAGKEDAEIASFSPDELVEEIVDILKAQADAKSIAVEVRSGLEGILIESDRRKCRHIFQNIIANAIKFTEKGKVEIESAMLADGKIEIRVRDSGIGIEKDQTSLIFNEFHQADGTVSRKFGGSGLGLSIADKYARMLGGNISVESELGKGSLFKVLLPVRFRKNAHVCPASPLEAPALSQNSVLDSDLSNKTILIIEDSEAAVLQIRDAIGEKNCRTIVAKNGVEALAILDKTVPDAIILDLMMPEIDGFKVLIAIRENDRISHVPVLVLSAKTIEKDELAMLKYNKIFQLIQKGDVNREELMRRICAMLAPKIQNDHAPKAPPPFIPKHRASRPVILAVEDNPDNMTTVKALLSEHCEIIEAGDGREAVEKAEARKPDLILMDIALPVMDGISAFKAIRGNPRLENIPIIALTASAMTSDRETILAHGFDAFISKPVDHRVFKETVFSYLKDIIS